MQGRAADKYNDTHKCIERLREVVEGELALSEAFKQILDIVCRRIGAREIVGTLVFGSTIALTWSSSMGIQHLTASEEKDRGLIRVVRKSEEPLLVSDLRGEHTQERARPKGYIEFCDDIQSELAVPILFNRKVAGVIDVGSSKPRAFDINDKTWLTDIASAIELSLAPYSRVSSSLLKAADMNQSRQVFDRAAPYVSELLYTKDLDQVLENILRDAVRYAELTNGYAYLHIVDGDRIVPQVEFIIRGGRIGKVDLSKQRDRQGWSRLVGYTGRAVRSADIVNVSDVPKDPDYHKIAGQENAQSEIVVPITWGLEHEVVATVDLVTQKVTAPTDLGSSDAESGAFTKDHEECLASLATRIALPLYMAQLAKRLDLERQALDGLASVAPSFVMSYPLKRVYKDIVDAVIRLIPTANVSHMLSVQLDEHMRPQYLRMEAVKTRHQTAADDKESTRFGKFGVEHGVSGAVVRSQQRIYISDISDFSESEATRGDTPSKEGEEIDDEESSSYSAEQYIKYSPNTQSELAIPLPLSETVLGVLNIESNIKDAFSQRDQNVAALLATEAICAISSAQNYLRKLDQASSAAAAARAVIESMTSWKHLHQKITAGVAKITRAAECTCTVLRVDEEHHTLWELRESDPDDQGVPLIWPDSSDPRVQAILCKKPRWSNEASKNSDVPSAVRSRVVIPLLDAQDCVTHELDLHSTALHAFSSPSVVRSLQEFGVFAQAALSVCHTLDHLLTLQSRTSLVIQDARHILNNTPLSSLETGLRDQAPDLLPILSFVHLLLERFDTRALILNTLARRARGYKEKSAYENENILELVREVVDQYRHSLATQRISMLHDSVSAESSHDVTTPVDGALVQLAVVELLDNALASVSAQDHPIFVSVEPFERTIEILVEDYGDTLPTSPLNQDIDISTQPLRNVHSLDAGSRRRGYGLRFVQNAMAELDGRVRWEPVTDQNGSTIGNRFVLAVPKFRDPTRNHLQNEGQV